MHYHAKNHPGYFENRIPLKPVLGGVCSLANYSVAYEETQSNRISEFRDFVYSLFPKAILESDGDVSGTHIMTCYYSLAQIFANSSLSGEEIVSADS